MNNSLTAQILAESIKANQFALDMKGRSFGLKFATVTDNRDPLNMRRLKVTLEQNAGLVSTDWAMHLNPHPNLDAPLPAVGTSVIVAAIDNDPHDLVWWGPLHNDTNFVDEQQQDFINDNTQTIPGDNKLTIGRSDTQTVEGDRTTTVKGDYTHTTEQNENRTVQGAHTHTVNQAETRRTDQNLTINCGKAIALKTDSGCSITLTEAGFIVLGDAFGNRMVLGGSSGSGGYASDLEWIMQGDINLRVNGKVKINDREICVTGGNDNEGDSFVRSGQ